MDVTNIIRAIRARCPALGNRVFGAARFGALTEAQAINPQALPAVYVLCLREDADDLQRTENSYYQEITATIGVVIVASNTEDERGQDSAAQIETVARAVNAAILGWSPTDDKGATISFSQMSTLDMNRALLSRMYEYVCTYAIGESETWIPNGLADGGDGCSADGETVGRLDTLDLSIDKIETPPGAPDGHEDAHLRFDFADDESGS